MRVDQDPPFGRSALGPDEHVPGQARRIGGKNDQFGRARTTAPAGHLVQRPGHCPGAGERRLRVEVPGDPEVRRIGVEHHRRPPVAIEVDLHPAVVYGHAGEHLPEDHVAAPPGIHHLLKDQVRQVVAQAEGRCCRFQVGAGRRLGRGLWREGRRQPVSGPEDAGVFVEAAARHAARAEAERRVFGHEAGLRHRAEPRHHLGVQPGLGGHGAHRAGHPAPPHDHPQKTHHDGPGNDQVGRSEDDTPPPGPGFPGERGRVPPTWTVNATVFGSPVSGCGSADGLRSGRWPAGAPGTTRPAGPRPPRPPDAYRPAAYPAPAS